MRFEFIRTLGSGAHGVVELHRDNERGGAYVALKRLHPHLKLTLGSEIALALSVTHRNVCRVYDIHRDGDVTMISMEYVEGETLREIIQRSAPLHVAEALKIFGQLADGIEEAHAQGVIHCDLKPENVMVSRDGVVKIMDFGLAMRVPLTVGVREQGRQIAGTPGYMAPEQAEGRSDKRTDIYLLGALLYEMLTGAAARKKPLEFPRAVPSDVQSVIRKCLEKDPDRRFQSMAELRNAPAEPARRPPSSYRTILGVCLLLAVGFVAFLSAKLPRRQPAAAASAADSRPAPAPAPVKPGAAKMLADGEYFLQNNLVDDALAQFDRALELDGTLAEAHFQRGLALVKLKRWDDAIASFKRALPDSASQRLVTWEWNSSFAPGLRHGLIWLRTNRVLYAERKGKDTILALVDLEQHRIRRLQIPDNLIQLNSPGRANDRMIVLSSSDLRLPADRRGKLYAVSAQDASLLWHIDLAGSGSQLPWAEVVARGLLTYVPGRNVLSLYDERSAQPRWTRADLPFNPTLAPLELGDAVVINESTPNGARFHGLNLADGNDAWTLDLPALATTVAPVGEKDVLYFVSKQSELFAVNAGASSGSILWHTAAGKDVVSLGAGAGRLYAGTASGDLRMIDAGTGAITKTSHVDAGALSVDYVGSNLVVATSATAIHGVSGKSWEYPSRFAKKNVKVADGIVLARTAEDEIVALDGDSGAVLWRHNGPLVADGVFTTKSGIFIADESGVKQYSTEKPAGTVTNKQILLEVAAALLNKGDAKDAASFVAKIETEIDPASPQLRLLRARLSLAEEKAKGGIAPLKAGVDLAAFAAASGLASEASRPVIADLKSGYGLLWVQAGEAILPGSPVRVGRWLLNLGPGTGANMQIVALNPETGEPAWRQPAQRFIDGVAPQAEAGKAKPQVFYVTGDNGDPTAVTLRRIDAATGEAIDLAHWNRTQPILLGRIALAAGRVFVLTVSSNPQTRIPEIAVDAFDGASGRQLWPTRINDAVLPFPIGLFMPQGDALVYSSGRDIWNIRGADGAVLDHQRENEPIGPNLSHTPVPNGPIYYVTTRKEISAYDTAAKQIRNAPRPEVDSPQLVLRAGMLFGTDKGSLFGFDLQSGAKWQIPAAENAKFLNVQDGDKNLWALRDDNVLAAIDRSNGKVMSTQSSLWRPSAYTVSSGRVYAFTADGLVYALRIR